MAGIMRSPKIPPAEINKFLGLNEDTTGETSLALGESPEMENFRITENYKLRKREGYDSIFSSLGTATYIQGMWYGKISASAHFLFACNGNVYEHTMNSTSNTTIGTVSNTASPVTFFGYDNKVYLMDGSGYKYWDGANTVSDVTGYIPTIYISTPPAGGGTAYENINLLTGSKKQQFSADGTSSTYYLVEESIDADPVIAWVNSVQKAETTDFTVNRTAGTVIFNSTPSAGVNNVEIQWTKDTAGNREEITGCKYAMLFGGSNDTRVHLWGNPSHQNTRYHSELTANGDKDAEYFAVTNYTEIGSDETRITDIVRQYDRQIIFKEGESFYSYYDNQEFPVYPLNAVVGQVADNQTRILQNNPYTIYKGVHQLVATNVRDEKNAQYMSKRVQPSMDDVDLTEAVTVDWESKWEFWIAIGTTVFVYNYRLDVWYKFTLAHKPTSFVVIDNVLYFGTENGQIMYFGDNIRSDDGQAISATWEMGFYDFEAEWLRKFANRLWLTLNPESQAKVDITYQTDRDYISNTYSATYNLITFESMDFRNFSFNTNYNPQPFRFKIKAKKFAFLKFILSSISDIERATVLSLNMKYKTGGEVK